MSLRHCERYGHRVEDTADCMCPSCIFWQKDIKACMYTTWFPGLKQGREWDEGGIKDSINE